MFKALITIYNFFWYNYSIRNTTIFYLAIYMCKFFATFDNHTAFFVHDRNTMWDVHVQMFVLFWSWL